MQKSKYFYNNESVPPSYCLLLRSYDICTDKATVYWNLSINRYHTIWCKTLSFLGFLVCSQQSEKFDFETDVQICPNVLSHTHVKTDKRFRITSVSSSQFIQSFRQFISRWLMQSKTAWHRYHPTIFVHFWFKSAILNFE